VKVALLSREFPPEVYGGAGVHVEYLARELAALVDLGVHCFGTPRESPLVAGTYQPWDALAGGGPHRSALRTMSVDLAMAAGVEGCDLVHSHTWYANFAGHLAKLLYDVPHVATTHSLEPLRPWKAEQLGGGYALSSFCERTGLEHADAVIAVSRQMRDDVLRAYPAVDPERVVVIHNGIDPEEYAPDHGRDVLDAYGIDPQRPSVVFVGRITRQKGLVHLLQAAPAIAPEAQLVLCAGAPDTPEIAAEVRALVEGVRARRGGVVWIEVGEQRYKWVARHKYKYESSLNTTNAQRNLNMQAGGADVVSLAHKHFVDYHAKQAGGRKVCYIRCGTYKIWDDYGQAIGGHKGEIGVPIVIFYPDRHKVVGFDDLEDGLLHLRALRGGKVIGKTA